MDEPVVGTPLLVKSGVEYTWLAVETAQPMFRDNVKLGWGHSGQGTFLRTKNPKGYDLGCF